MTRLRATSIAVWALVTVSPAWPAVEGAGPADSAAKISTRMAQRRLEARRGQARALRGEILFVQQRLRTLKGERASSIAWAVVKGLKPSVIGGIEDAFNRRQARLIERLDYLSGRLRQIEKTINRDSGHHHGVAAKEPLARAVEESGSGEKKNKER